MQQPLWDDSEQHAPAGSSQNDAAQLQQLLAHMSQQARGQQGVHGVQFQPGLHTQGVQQPAYAAYPPSVPLVDVNSPRSPQFAHQPLESQLESMQMRHMQQPAARQHSMDAGPLAGRNQMLEAMWASSVAAGPQPRHSAGWVHAAPYGGGMPGGGSGAAQLAPVRFPIAEIKSCAFRWPPQPATACSPSCAAAPASCCARACAALCLACTRHTAHLHSTI